MNQPLIDQLKLAIQVESEEVPLSEVECRYRSPGFVWFLNAPLPELWNHKEYEYRRKPKPLECWVLFYSDRSARAFDSIEEATKAFEKEKNSYIAPTGISRMREVE